jgi:hypothetical protein
VKTAPPNMPPYDAAIEQAWSQFLERVIEKLKAIAQQANANEPYYNRRLRQWRCDRHSGRTSDACDGTNSHSDSQQFCERPDCGRVIRVAFTEWGAREELWYSLQEPSDRLVSPNEAITLLMILDNDLPRRTERWSDVCHGYEDREAVRHIARRLPLAGKEGI